MKLKPFARGLAPAVASLASGDRWTDREGYAVATDKITLKYGGGKVDFAKSASLIAIRPRAGMAGRLRDELGAVSMRMPAAERGKLGGFKLVELATSAEETDRELDTLRRSPTVAAGSHVFHTGADNVPFVPTGELFVVFKEEGASEAERQALLDDHHLQLVEARGKGEFIVRVTSASENPVKAAASLQKSELVEVAEPEFATPGRLKVTRFTAPADPLLQEQWHLKNTGRLRGSTIGLREGADARVIAAWEAMESLGSRQVVVAVIDDGFDLGHPDLAGKVIHARDFTRNSSDPSPSPETADWHGTACAGVAVGRPGGGDIVGAAPAATLMPIRWGPDLADSQVEAWFDYVTTRGAWVVSCSWGAAADYFPLSTRVSRAIRRCATEGRNGRGCVVVFAAGNSSRDINDDEAGTLDGFAVHPDVVAVAASTSRDKRSDYSNFGDEIWVCAPSSGAGGWGIVTSDVTGSIELGGSRIPLGYAAGDYTYDFGGTSSACPLVAGICALVFTANPELTAAEVKELLRDTARKIGEGYTDGHSPYFGYGCIDAEAAVRHALETVRVAEASVGAASTPRTKPPGRKRFAASRKSRLAQQVDPVVKTV
jgi:subtilisin family serine protease